MRITGELELALQSGDAKQYWSGQIELPLPELLARGFQPLDKPAGTVEPPDPTQKAEPNASAPKRDATPLDSRE